MPSVTRKPQVARKQQRREELGLQLLRATEQLMGEGLAFTEISVDRLASEAGISRATFYVYFEDKAQLLKQFAREIGTAFNRAAAGWWGVVDERNSAQLQGALAGVAELYRTHRSVIRAVGEMSAYDPDIDQFYRGIMDEITEPLVGIIERGQASGAISSAIPGRETAAALTWMVERTCQQLLRDDSADEGVVVTAMTEVIWRTLYLEPAAER